MRNLLAMVITKKEGLLFLALFIFAFCIFWQFGPLWQPVGLDPGMQVYIGQEMLRGHPPYLWVIFPKTPLTAMITALAILIGDRVAIADMISGRLVFLILGALGVCFTFLVGKFISSRVAPRLVSALALAGFAIWGFSSAAGPEPKVLMILFGLAALWSIANGRWFIAGLLGCLSFLTWQPGGIYPALTIIASLAEKGEQRRRAFLHLAGGILIPTALVAVYLLIGTALAPALRQTMLSQLAYLADGVEGATVSKGFSRLLRVGGAVLAPEMLFVVLGALGLLGLTIYALRTWRRALGNGQTHPWLVVVSGYFWLVFSLRDFNYAPDLLPLLPYLALGLGWLVGQAIILLDRWSPALPVKTRLSPVLGIAATFLTLFYGLGDFPPPKDTNALTLGEEMEQVAKIDAFLGSRGRVQAVGDLSLLVLSERENLTPLIHLGPKHYNLLLYEPGGLEGIIHKINGTSPKVLVLHPRIQNRPWAQPLWDLAAADYQPYLTSTHPEEGQVFARLLVQGELDVDRQLDFRLGENFRLIGYRIANSEISGQHLAVTLYWESVQETSRDYTVFLHLVDTQGVILAQGDAPPASGYYPTLLWKPGDIIEDTHLLFLSPDLPTGEYHLQLGMYLLETGERLPVQDENGRLLGEDQIIISGVGVE